MTRAELEHIIRASADITDPYEFVIIGSQSTSAGGKRYIVVALANSDNAPNARLVWDALIDWVAG